jgi:hypothetical protein
LALATVIFGASSILCVGAALADTQVFKDTLRPHGVERSQALKFADGRKCGLSASGAFSNATAFQKCMAKRGWALDHIVPDPPPTYIGPETGMECHDEGIAAICEPPKGTVTYVNKHGYPCKRTGLVAVCGNL